LTPLAVKKIILFTIIKTMENSAALAFAITFIAGMATAIGAGISLIIKRGDFKALALGMSFSAGVMIYLSFMDILPMSIIHAQQGNGAEGGLGETAGYALAVGMFFAGLIFAGVIDYFVPEHIGHEMVEGDDAQAHKRKRANRVALMTAIGLSVHNFPEGFSVFVTSLENVRVGAAVGLAIMLHNIPEGVAVALPILSATGDRKKAFWVSTLSGFAEPAGAIVAYLILMPFLTPVVVGAVLAATAGVMVYISLDELLPMAKEYGRAHDGIVGAALGMAMMAVVTFVIGK